MVTRIPASPWLVDQIRRVLLPAWFAVFAMVHVLDIIPEARLGFDARIYQGAASALLAGQDPWALPLVTGDTEYHFAGLPPTVLLFIPTAFLAADIAAFLVIGVSLIAGAYTIRKLGLPWYWLIFPPLVQGVLLGNPGILVLALLVTGHPLAEGAAAAVKVYALLPMVTRLRLWGTVVFGLAAVASMVVAPGLWVRYADRSLDIAGRLVTEASGGVGAWVHPALLFLTIAALLVILRLDYRAAGWLAVPSMWPGAQFHYPVMAMPVMTIPMAFVLAPPIFGLPAVAVILYAWVLAWHRLRGT